MDEQAISTFYHIGIDLDFENIYSFCKFTEIAFKQEKDKFYALYKTKLNELKAEEKEKFEQLAIEIHWKLYSIFPELQWNSIFNSAYAMFEKHLNDVCKILEKDTKTEIGLKDLKGHPILELYFADKGDRIFLPDVQSLFSLVLETPPQKEIPDYNGDRHRRPDWAYGIDIERPNYDYYRKLVKFTSLNRLLSPINFAIKNSGSVVAKDVRIELKIKDQDNIIKALDEYHMPNVPKSSYSAIDHINYQVQNVGISHDLTVRRISDYWLIETGVEKVQPQSTEWIHSRFYIGAIKSVNFAIEVSIYSDDLPEPTTKRLIIKIKSEKREVGLEDIKELELERFKNSTEYKKFLKMHAERNK